MPRRNSNQKHRQPTPEQVKQIMGYYGSGMKIREIKELFYLHLSVVHGTVYRHPQLEEFRKLRYANRAAERERAKQLDDERKYARVISVKTVQDMKRLRLKGHSYQDIADELCVSKTTVIKYLRQQGVE